MKLLSPTRKEKVSTNTTEKCVSVEHKVFSEIFNPLTGLTLRSPPHPPGLDTETMMYSSYV